MWMLWLAVYMTYVSGMICGLSGCANAMPEGSYSGKAVGEASAVTAAAAAVAETAVEDTAVRQKPPGGFVIPEARGVEDKSSRDKFVVQKVEATQGVFKHVNLAAAQPCSRLTTGRTRVVPVLSGQGTAGAGDECSRSLLLNLVQAMG